MNERRTPFGNARTAKRTARGYRCDGNDPFEHTGPSLSQIQARIGATGMAARKLMLVVPFTI